MSRMIPIGKEERTDEDFEVEILYLFKQIRVEDNLYGIEFSFTSDHQKFITITTNGIPAPPHISTWAKIEDVRQAAADLISEGYTEIWNPTWQPHLQEYKKEVSFI